ncbi:NPL domain-containing protein [Raphanus sativus]|nr:NPL domain-containing protein [Raphanus sativus]
MESWGIELKPGKPRYFRLRNLNNEHRILHITATLCEGVGKEKSVIQYSVGDNKSPVDLCALSPNENESFSLSLELGCDDNSVEFSVTGDRCIDLTGYLQIDNPNRRNSIKMRHESNIRGSLRDSLPSREEICRLWSTLSLEESEETMVNYLTNNDV